MRLSAMNNENVAFIYEKKFQKWLFKNSHKKQWNQPEEFNSLKFNNKGKIINAQFSKRTKNGIELTEKQFIEHELYRLSKLDYNTLKTADQKATYNLYQKFLASKLIEPQSKKIYINSQTGSPFDYVLIGALFAQNLIKQQGQTWYYGKEIFPTPKELATFIHNNEPKLKNVKEKTIYTIVNSTLSGTSKSIFKDNRQMKIISAYCKDNNINIESSEFKKHIES